MRIFIAALLALALAAGVAVAGDDPLGPDEDPGVEDGAVIEQVGDNNDATINQLNSAGAINQGVILQYNVGNGADGNEALLDQSTAGNTGFIDQVGEGNRARINFDGEGGHTGIVVQEGEGHNIGFTMEGEGNLADIRQYGTSAHTVGVAGTFDAPGAVFQVGNDNVFEVVQEGDGDGHLVTTPDGEDVIQQGDNNKIFVTQHGDGATNEARLLQANGDVFGNTITLHHEGGGNTATVQQRSDNNSAVVSQNGNNNTATITQD